MRKYIILMTLALIQCFGLSAQTNVALGKQVSGSMTQSDPSPSGLVDGNLTNLINVGSFYDGEFIDGDLIIDFAGDYLISSMKVYQNAYLDLITLYYYKDNNWVLLSARQNISDGNFTISFPEVATSKFKMVCSDIDMEPECWIAEVEVYGTKVNILNVEVGNFGSVFANKLSVTESIGLGTNDPQEKLHINGAIRGNIGNGALRIKSADGYIDIGPQNAGWAHIYTDRPSFVFNKPVYLYEGTLVAYSSSDFKLKTNNVVRLFISGSTGNVLINKTTQTNTNYKLDVAGKVRANEVVVNTTGADFVFEKDYKLPSLKEVELYIAQHKHLPGVDPAAKMEAEGTSVGEMQTKLLQKLEETTLYLIEMQKQIEQLKKENEELKKNKTF